MVKDVRLCQDHDPVSLIQETGCIGQGAFAKMTELARDQLKA
jgi:hypothetical protein